MDDTMNPDESSSNTIFCNGNEHDPLSPSNLSNSNLSSHSNRGRSKVWNQFVVTPDKKKV